MTTLTSSSSSSSLQPPKTPLPANLHQELPDPKIPWKISDRIMEEIKGQKGVSFKKVEVRPTDPEWRFIWKYFHHDKPSGYDIGRIYCLHERHQVQAFELNLSSQEREADKFAPTWKKEPRAKQRAKAISRWHTATDPFSPFQTMESDGRRRTWKKTKVLPLWHGSSKEVCESVGESGFMFFGKQSLGTKKSSDPKSTDDGFFGSGIYFTNSARYAADIYSQGHILLGWISMREPFPVVGDAKQQDMQTLRGRGAYKHYNAHYVPVHPEDKTPSCAMYYPCKSKESAYCDEVVVFQKAQTLPRFWVELQPSILHLIQIEEEPQCVSELLPHVHVMLQHPAVDRDQKSRKALNAALEKLMQLPGDDYLDDHNLDTLYPKLQQLLVAGKVNRSIAKELSSSSSATTAVTSQQATMPQAKPITTSSHTVKEPKQAFIKESFKADLAKALEASKASLPSPVPPKPQSSSSTLTQVAPVQQMKVEAPKLPAIAFGKEKWARYFGDVGVEPPLPADIDKILKSKCPFWPSKRVEETHMLTLIPATIDGKPFCLDLLEELIQKPKTGCATRYARYWVQVKAEHGQKAPAQSYWALMTRDILEGTRYKDYKDQCVILNKQRKEKPYEAPRLLDAATAILMEHVGTGQRLFNREPVTYTRCQEQTEGCQTAVGDFGAPGLSIGNYINGLAASWKF